jgi:hypothetical protein
MSHISLPHDIKRQRSRYKDATKGIVQEKEVAVMQKTACLQTPSEASEALSGRGSPLADRVVACIAVRRRDYRPDLHIIIQYLSRTLRVAMT